MWIQNIMWMYMWIQNIMWMYMWIQNLMWMYNVDTKHNVDV